MERRITPKVRPAFLAALLLLSGMGFVSYRSTQQLVAAQRAVARSYQLVKELQALHAGLADAQTAQRGYLLTGQTRYLAPYQAAVPTIDKSLSALRQLTARDPQQQRSLARLQRLSAQQMALIHTTIALKRQKRFSPQAEAARIDEGKAVMDGVRTALAKMEAQEDRRLLGHRRQAERTADQTMRLIILASFLGVALVATVTVSIDREVARDLAQRRRADEERALALEELQHANERLAVLAACDGLTGLANHRAFHERLEAEFQRALRERTPLSLLLLDVDRFKQFNDTFGHLAGDEVLKTVAWRLEHEARGGNIVGGADLVARIGGEEFAVVLPQTDAVAAWLVAERLRTAIESWLWTKRAVTVSVGVATLAPADSHPITSSSDFFAAADAVLYRAKGSGRNRVIHADDAPELAARENPSAAAATVLERSFSQRAA